MTIKEAINVVNDHSEWRRGNKDKMVYPDTLLNAFGIVVNAYQPLLDYLTIAVYKLPNNSPEDAALIEDIKSLLSMQDEPISEEKVLFVPPAKRKDISFVNRKAKNYWHED